MMKTAGALLVLGLALAVVPALAQTPPYGYKLRQMNFDMWCQETMHYPASRCDKRLPEDDKAFDKYRSTVEHYELQRQQEQRNGQVLDQGILYNEPQTNNNSPQPYPGSSGTIPNPQE